MFAKFIYEMFPVVVVKFSRDIENAEDFDLFLKKWIELYENKKEFIFVFDTTQVGYPSIKYCVRMSMFIKKLRKEKIQYLKRSIIIVKISINLIRAFSFIPIWKPQEIVII